tara:strand:+ start:182 stop:319 length:138 start_codon:yes stop_codon:yes gene_type:complete
MYWLWLVVDQEMVNLVLLVMVVVEVVVLFLDQRYQFLEALVTLLQ